MADEMIAYPIGFFVTQAMSNAIEGYAFLKSKYSA